MALVAQAASGQKFSRATFHPMMESPKTGATEARMGPNERRMKFRVADDINILKLLIPKDKRNCG